MPVRVLIAEDHVLLREGLARLLEERGFVLAASVGDADKLIVAAHTHRPDLVIADIQMPPRGLDDGLVAVQRIRRELPGVAVLVLSQFLEERYLLDLVGADAQGVGYLLKDRVADVDSFVEACHRVAAGGSALDPQVVGRMVARRRENSALDALTPRERQVLALMAEGRSNPGIAAALGVSAAAVEKHATSVFRKLELGHERLEHRRVMAVLAHLRAV